MLPTRGCRTRVALTSSTGSTTISTPEGRNRRQAGQWLTAHQGGQCRHLKDQGQRQHRHRAAGFRAYLRLDGRRRDTFNGSAVGQYNVTMRRVEVVGARQSVSCNENRDIQDSWLHAQYIKSGSDWHGDGFISNGGSNMLLRHNTLACDSLPTGAGGACSAAVAAFGDFAPIQNHTYDNNLFVSSPAGYCMYAGYDPAKPYGKLTKNVQVINNVFQRGSSGKCAVYGPVAAVAPSGGNVFSGNVRDDGQPVLARNS